MRHEKDMVYYSTQYLPVQFTKSYSLLMVAFWIFQGDSTRRITCTQKEENRKQHARRRRIGRVVRASYGRGFASATRSSNSSNTEKRIGRRART
jgi:hypothetical protein